MRRLCLRANFRGVTIFLVAVVGSVPAAAQTSQSEIRGTVVDQSGAALPGVTVTATHVDTGAARTTVTSETGVFLMPALPVGLYRVQLELAGFTQRRARESAPRGRAVGGAELHHAARHRPGNGDGQR